jgi:hypothetical protein
VDQSIKAIRVELFEWRRDRIEEGPDLNVLGTIAAQIAKIKKPNWGRS